MKCFGKRSDGFHFPDDYEIAGHTDSVKAFCGNFMKKFFYRMLHMTLLLPEIQLTSLPETQSKCWKQGFLLKAFWRDFKIKFSMKYLARV